MNDSLRDTVQVARQLATFDNAKTVVFWYLVQLYSRRALGHVIAAGPINTAQQLYQDTVDRLFLLARRIVPSLGRQVNDELDKVTAELEAKLAPRYDGAPPQLSLPAVGLSPEDVSSALVAHSSLARTRWEEGRVSGAVYNGSDEMDNIWQEAFKLFTVSNPLHADVFPGVRKMDSDVVSMCLSLYNAPLPKNAVDQSGGAGTTTSGGTESILMSCLAHRNRAKAEFGITRPEMICPISAHAAFDKASKMFGIKVHWIPVDPKTRKVQINRVKRAINSNTILLVGSAPNFGDGAIDDIEALGKLAIKYRLGLHVDCCLGSFIVPFLERAGFPTTPFDFRVPGVTAISCDTHKYGFAPKGSSVIMYRSKAIRKYQYSIITTWPGGVYASPSLAGSRPGAILAGAYASLIATGLDGYTASCKQIVGAAKQLATAIRKDFPELHVLGEPLASVVAFGSESIPIYEVGDLLSARGWHLNGLQHPPALHLACTRLHTSSVIDELLVDLRKAVDEVKVKVEKGEVGKGSMVTMYGLGSSSAIGPGLVREMATRYMDVLYA